MSAGQNPLWIDNSVQFPRLLAEIVATQEHIDMEAPARSMDLKTTMTATRRGSSSCKRSRNQLRKENR